MLCFASQTITLDLSPIIDALTKKAIKEMEARVNKRIAEILGEPSDGIGIGGRLALVAWCVYFLPVGVLAYRHFSGQHRKS